MALGSWKVLEVLVLKRTDLFGHSGEPHHVEGLVVGGGTLVDVDHHGGFSSATEEGLEELGQLALSEGDAGAPGPGAGEAAVRSSRSSHSSQSSQQVLPLRLAEAQSRDALSQDEQRGVDVPGLLQPLASRLGSGAPL